MQMSVQLPDWLTKKIPCGSIPTENILNGLNLNTVCVSAHCPNRGECFSKGEATFMILGNVCTRNCNFCAVQKGRPLVVDLEEPKKIADAVREMGLKYIVVTSVTRDDLEDGGASQFAEVARLLRKFFKYDIGIEFLIPDLGGNWQALELIVRQDINVLNHNIETVGALYPKVRPQANYGRSLELLKKAKDIKPTLFTKSGLMLGLGESEKEIIQILCDLRKAECDFLTIGQYLRPGPGQLEVKEYITPEDFEKYKTLALGMGFIGVASGPFVRSSYNARSLYESGN